MSRKRETEKAKRAMVEDQFNKRMAAAMEQEPKLETYKQLEEQKKKDNKPQNMVGFIAGLGIIMLACYLSKDGWPLMAVIGIIMMMQADGYKKVDKTVDKIK